MMWGSEYQIHTNYSGNTYEQMGTYGRRQSLHTSVQEKHNFCGSSKRVYVACVRVEISSHTYFSSYIQTWAKMKQIAPSNVAVPSKYRFTFYVFTLIFRGGSCVLVTLFLFILPPAVCPRASRSSGGFCVFTFHDLPALLIHLYLRNCSVTSFGGLSLELGRLQKRGKSCRKWTMGSEIQGWVDKHETIESFHSTKSFIKSSKK